MIHLFLMILTVTLLPTHVGETRNKGNPVQIIDLSARSNSTLLFNHKKQTEKTSLLTSSSNFKQCKTHDVNFFLLVAKKENCPK